MRPRQVTSPQVFVARRNPPHRRFSLPLLLITTLTAIPLLAQNAPPSTPDNSAPYTLHLYARLVELPTTILLRKDHRPVLLDPQQINITLNASKPFHPTSLRLEGDDPLSIALLLDVSGDQPALLSAIQKDFSGWVARSLHPNDHVSIFALDCDLFQTSYNAPANPSVLQTGLDLALTSPLPHGKAPQPSCARSIRLRGSIVFVLRKLSQLPGRRILLVVTAGRDGKSTIRWSELGAEAGLDSVTVFGLTSPEPGEFQRISDINSLAQDSGGFLFAPAPSVLPNALDQMISLLRKRYILQFPMPHDLSPVVYHVVVTVPKFDALIRPSGIGVPLPNPSLDHPSTDVPTEAPPSSPNPQP